MSARTYFGIALMAVVTYAIRMIPFVTFRKKITSPFMKSFLYYTPYAVLAAMTIPDIFSATDRLASAVVGFVVATVLSLRRHTLLVVAIAACVSAYLTDLVF